MFRRVIKKYPVLSPQKQLKISQHIVKNTWFCRNKSQLECYADI